MKNELALIIIYNHRYDKNIDILERIYKDRFSNIYHLVPFYDGDKENVIPVYENSYYFQGYIAQGFRDYFKSSYKHYFFIADDMIINPVINEENYKELFKLDDGSGFISRIEDMPGPYWDHNRAAVSYNPNKKGVEIKNEIPSLEEAKKVVDRLNIKNGRYSISQTYFYKKDYRFLNILYQGLLYMYDRFVLKTKLKSSKYPFIRGYSDILIVSATNIRKFIHYCGAFAATDLWVEVAIPTALALSGEKIVVENDLTLKGRALWTKDEYKILDKYNNKLKALLNDFPKDYIYLHAIKLSKWDTNIE